MSYVIQRVLSYNWYPRFDDTDTVDVVIDTVGQKADIKFVLPCVWCHILEFISDIMEVISWIQYTWCHKNVVWCHKMWMWGFIGCIWYYTYSGCDDLYTKGFISLKVWVWWHTFRGCDVIYNGYDVIIYSRGDLKNSLCVVSSIMCMWWHRYSGYDVQYSGCDVIKMVAWGHKVRMWCLV